MGIEVSVRDSPDLLEVHLRGTLHRSLLGQLGIALEAISSSERLTVINLTAVDLVEDQAEGFTEERRGLDGVAVVCPDQAVVDRLRAWEVSWIEAFYPSLEVARAVIRRDQPDLEA